MRTGQVEAGGRQCGANGASHGALGRWLASGKGFAFVFLFLLLGDFISISQISPTLSYNYLSSSLMYIAAGLLFAYMARRQAVTERSSRWPDLLLIGAGTLMGLDLFVKFSTSIFFLGLSVLWLVLDVQPGQARVRPALCLLGGFAVGVAGYFLCISPFDFWLRNFRQSLAEQAGSTHNPFKVIARQIADTIRIGRSLLTYFAVPLLGLYFVARRLRQAPASCAWVVVPLFLPLACWLALKAYPIWNFRFYTLYYLVVILTLLVVNAGLWGWTMFSPWRRSMVWLLLLAFPFVLFFGSGASFSYSMPVYMMPWFACCLLLLLRLPPGRLRSGSLLAFILVSQGLFVVSYLYYPWRWVENRVSQTEPVVGVPGLQGMRVDPPTWKFIQESRRLAAMAPAGPQSTGPRPMIGLYELPGMIYWLDGVAPGLPALFKTNKEQDKNCSLLTAAAKTMDLTNALILVQDKLHPKLEACLPTAGIDLKTYRSLGKVYNPYAHKDIEFLVRTILSAEPVRQGKGEAHDGSR